MTEDLDCRWRESSNDYKKRLQQFRCARPMSFTDMGQVLRDADEEDIYNKFVIEEDKVYWSYEKEVEDFIRLQFPYQSLSFAYHKEMICVTRPHGMHEDERIYAFVSYAVEDQENPEDLDVVYIAFIARSLDADGCHFGDIALKYALQQTRKRQIARNRLDQTVAVARIDALNIASQKLFTRNGFEDCGIDPKATEYHRWVRSDME